MLVWVGKRPLAQVTAFPAQHVETFDPSGALGRKPVDTQHWKDWPATYPKGGLLFHGDNKEVVAHLLANGFRGKVNLIYIDPPFDSGADYVRKVSLRGAKGTAKIDGEGYTLGEQIQYTDIWANDNYLQFMYERLLLLRELLSLNGSVYVHCDPRRSHHLRCLLDEAFGPDAFVAEVVWKRSTAHSDAKFLGALHDTILWYAKGEEPAFNRQYTAHDQAYIESHYTQVDERGRRFLLDNITSPHPRPNLTYEWKGYRPPQFGWRYERKTMEELDRQGRIHYPAGGGRPRLKRFLDEMPGVPLQDLWDDINPVNSQALEATGFPTQKPAPLMERILKVSSNPGDLILDCFVGSGTTAAVAQKLGRRWIGCDINKGAIQLTANRLHGVIREQIELARKDEAKSRQGKLIGVDEPQQDAAPEPAQLAFTTWRVNDYDLAIQHNEAVNLACEHIGIERTRSDAYFDGTLGRQLAKIIPFGHPLTPLDLEELRRELEARPEEDRPVTIVCLGMEIAAQAWIEEWNRLRKGKDAVNRITVIELRSDERYGKFIRHEPARAKVKVTRTQDKIRVEIEDFISPTILERLEQQASLVKPKIDDWRAMVDCVMIDSAYDGSVFNVVVSDVPEKRTDLVQGRYEIPGGKAPTRVAVKIIDMLGEEVLVVEQL